MALFGSLSERLNHIFSKLTKRGKLTELEIRSAMREVRVALLEADVNLKVAKQFIANVSEKAVGQEVLASLLGKGGGAGGARLFEPRPAGHQDRQRRAHRPHGAFER